MAVIVLFLGLLCGVANAYSSGAPTNFCNLGNMQAGCTRHSPVLSSQIGGYTIAFNGATSFSSGANLTVQVATTSACKGYAVAAYTAGTGPNDNPVGSWATPSLSAGGAGTLKLVCTSKVVTWGGNGAAVAWTQTLTWVSSSVNTDVDFYFTVVEDLTHSYELAKTLYVGSSGPAPTPAVSSSTASKTAASSTASKTTSTTTKTATAKPSSSVTRTATARPASSSSTASATSASSGGSADTSTPCPNSCSGHGTCLDPVKGPCVCNDGYGGSGCDVKTQNTPFTLDPGRFTLSFEITNNVLRQTWYVDRNTFQQYYVGIGLFGESGHSGDTWLAFLTPGAPPLTATDVNSAPVSLNGYIDMEDGYVSGFNMPQKDTEQDLKSVDAYYNYTHVVISFSRALDTGDAQDSKIVQGSMRMAWVVGDSQDSTGYCHPVSTSGRFSVDFFTGTVVATASRSRIFMAILFFAICVCVAVAVAFCLRNKSCAASGYGEFLLRQRLGCGYSGPCSLPRTNILSQFTFDFIPNFLDLTVGEFLFVILYLFGCYLFYITGRDMLVRDSKQPKRIWAHICSLHIGLSLLPVTRNGIWKYIVGISWERAVKFHRWLGRIAFITILVHLAVEIQDQSDKWGTMWLDNESDQFGGNVWGTLALFSFAMIVATSLEPVRRHFWEVFSANHMLFFVCGIILSYLHSEQVAYYLGIPVLLYLVDRGVRLLRRCKSAKLVSFKLIQDSQSAVVVLTISVPKFTFEEGDYVFLNIPAISLFQWHPFSISSAPLHPSFTLHIQKVGGSCGSWTGSLVELAQSGALNSISLYVDGPYGCPSVPLHEYPYVVLVGGGIGACPIISLAEGMMDKEKGARNAGVTRNLKKLHVIWVVRYSSGAQWYPDVLSRLKECDFVQLHLYHTGKDQMPSLPPTEAPVSEARPPAPRMPSRPSFTEMAISPPPTSASAIDITIPANVARSPVPLRGRANFSIPPLPISPSGAPHRQSIPPPPPPPPERDQRHSIPPPPPPLDSANSSQANTPAATPRASQSTPRMPLIQGRRSSAVSVTADLHWNRGRPPMSDLFASFVRESGKGKDIAVAVCGPDLLVQEVQTNAHEYRMHLHRETFFL